jgi:hypothetical protein
MHVARITDSEGNLIKNDDGTIMRIDASKFKTKEDAKEFINNLSNELGINNLSYCCGYGDCRATVHFRTDIEKVAGKKSRARPAAWISDNIKSHEIGCPGPVNYNHEHISHNGLSLTEAIMTEGEYILLHLNMDLGVRTAPQFNQASGADTEDIKWRKTHKTCHSYFPIDTLEHFTSTISQIYREGKRPALDKIQIAYEGLCPPFANFIVRNNVNDRMNLINRLKAKADHKNIYPSQYNDSSDFVFGSPRLVFFEAAQTAQKSEHPNKKKRARGWRHNVGDGRKVYDQLALQKTSLTVQDFFPHGAIVLARPFIHKHQNENFPILHWSIEGEGNIDLNPSSEITKILCWNGRNHPPSQPHHRQLTMELRP